MTTDEMSKKIDSITHKKEYIKITRLINKAERNLIFDKKDIEKFKLALKKKAEELNFNDNTPDYSRSNILTRILPYKDEILELSKKNYTTYQIYDILSQKYGESFTQNNKPFSFDRAVRKSILKDIDNKLIMERQSKYQIYAKESGKMLKEGQTKYKIWKHICEKYQEIPQRGFYKFLNSLEEKINL